VSDDQQIPLKGGAVTFDPRLDRIPRWDQQNDEYPIARLLTAAQLRDPRSYTWRVPVHLDQGREGACVGFAWAHELAARPVSVPNLTNAFAREQIYWKAQVIDEWEGGSYPGASPVYEGTSVLAGAKVMQGAGHFREYRWAKDVPDLAAAIGYAGPAVLGINWWTGMYDPDFAGYLHPTGSIAGGHAILCYSVNVKGRFFRVWNSWGADWGDGGTARISWDDMGQLLAENGEACIPVLRQKVAA
jgi:hypothetical protein